MLDRHRRAMLGRLADVALVAAFLALSAFAYGELSVGASRVVAAPAPLRFSDFYWPGQNPWAGAVIEPAPHERFVSATPARPAYR
ncbi:MAG: hypothetical protein ACLQJR_23940 [Stellaceae bacterium]